MREPDYKHVLFKDLYGYLRKEDYLGGFSTRELAYIRSNLGAASVDDLKRLTGESLELTYDDLLYEINHSTLVPGSIYVISDFQTIYLSEEKNDSGQYISWGDSINPSKVYKIATIALTTSLLLPLVSIIEGDSNSTKWTVLYNPEQETLDDGIKTKGKIIFLQDENLNRATYDFKNIKWKNGYTFDNNGSENSSNCYGNDLSFTKNVVIKYPIRNLVNRFDNVFINENLDALEEESQKQIILREETYYLDYLDLETLTHLFYVVTNSSSVTQ